MFEWFKNKIFGYYIRQIDYHHYSKSILETENRFLIDQIQKQAKCILDLSNAFDEYNRVIDFALKQGLECETFLAAWREGDISEWPEFE